MVPQRFVCSWRVLQVLPGSLVCPLEGRDCAWWGVQFLKAHSMSLFRNVKAILAASRELADSGPELNVLTVTAVRTAG